MLACPRRAHVTQPESVAFIEWSHIFLKKEVVAQVPYIAVHKKKQGQKAVMFTAKSSLYNTVERGERIPVTLNEVNMVVVSDLLGFS